MTKEIIEDVVCSVCKQTIKKPKGHVKKVVDGELRVYCSPCNLMHEMFNFVRRGQE